MKPITTEKAIMKLESENVLMFEFDIRKNKKEIKKEIEDLFDVKIDKIMTQTRNNKKIVCAKLNPKYQAIDIATKLGIM